MFQQFNEETRPEDGPDRLAALRVELAREGLDGFLVPRADAFQGEYVAARDARLAWLCGFTGSAGFCAALLECAGVFVDGRYRVQVKAQVALDHFTPVDWPEVKLGEWLCEALPDGGQVGFDPWLHTAGLVDDLRSALAGSGIEMVACDNLVDRVWADQPARAQGRVIDYPFEFSGELSKDKRSRLAANLRAANQRAAVITLPDSVCWLLNIRGRDIERNPVVHAFAILFDDASVTLFSDLDKFGDVTLDGDVDLQAWDGIEAALSALTGPVRVDKGTAPLQVSVILEGSGVEIDYAQDPCIRPKARKNPVEIAGTTKAHLRDAAAMVEFLCWLDKAAGQPGLSEIDIVKKLEGFRRATGALLDISFETICGSGPNGAIIHYQVNEASNRTIAPGDLLVIDSGGQYLDGTTDITRTVPVGPVGADERAAFSRVLQGMIALSRARWPVGLAGRDLDALARYPLWCAGQDYDHGTGHGVGVYLSVHEGPQRISRTGDAALEPGMILSNEPGYYREGAFGIRIENLLVVQEAPHLAGADARPMLSFDTLNYVPIDRRLIDHSMLTAVERDWLNAYHAEVIAKISPDLSDEARRWLVQAAAPI